MKYKLDVITNARYFGIMIRGTENIAKIRKYVHGSNGVELSSVTLNGKVYDDAVLLHDQDEFCGIALSNVSFGHWNSRQEIMEDMKSWEKRPYKHLLKIVKDAKLTQQCDGRVVLGEEWWNGPDWFVFSEIKRQKRQK